MTDVDLAEAGRPFEIRADRAGDRIDVDLIGELDDRTRDPFHQLLSMLEQARASEVVLHLRRLSFVDEDGQGALIRLWQRSVADEFQLRLVDAPDHLLRRFRITGVAKLLQLT